MTTVFCFSGSGNSDAVARFFAEALHCEKTDIAGDLSPQKSPKTAVVVFPIYCQNVPPPVKTFLEALHAPYVVLIATYGRISYGNVLHEVQKQVKGTVIAGAYVPIGHSLKGERADFDAAALFPILERIDHPSPAVIPKTPKHLFADVFPAWRSRVGIRLHRTDACTRCNACGENCPMGAIRFGKASGNCIRCLRCVSVCPHRALTFELRAVLKKYLKNHFKNEIRVYL